jgi:predicted outer membrane protein
VQGIGVAAGPRISRIIIGASAASVLAAAACRGGRQDDPSRARDTKAAAAPNIARDTVGGATNDTIEVAGEVVDDSSAQAPVDRWLFDPNVISLLSLMNARQMAAAEVELEEWHTGTVRDFASQMAHDHAALQRSIDSLAERLNLMPVRPAVASQIGAAFQAQIDSMVAYRAGPRGSLDRAFVRQQIAGHALMAQYVRQLAGVAERPELRALLASTATMVNTELARAKGMQAQLALADSQATVDSASKGDGRQKRDSTRD